MEKQEQNGYCPTCKKPQDRVALCDSCAGRRDIGKHTSDVTVRPPQINTLYDEEKREERLKKEQDDNIFTK